MTTKDKEVENTISNLGLNLEWEGNPIITLREVLCHLMYYCKWMNLDWDFEKFCAENTFRQETNPVYNNPKQLRLF